ncbi:putative membrane protein YczE [Arthrobacter sp. PL16]|uniref:membrane protein YczE n=1 Tax=Arthrobacter sp. PL16 TaxID=3071720 RepID=UPI002E0406E6|nr:putative membrane protein YczE [Arthrobacter sp. PL16]
MTFLGVRRGLQLLIGLFLYGLSLAMMIRATLGVSPWDVLGQGGSLQTGIPFGFMTNIIGLVVLLLWIPLRQRPGVGTILNVLLVGPSAEIGLALLGEPSQLWSRILLFTGGLVLLAIASGLYIGARLGPGPRDGLMTGIHARSGLPIWLVRTGIEGTVLVLGWVLGGSVGLGTVAFALLIGPLINLTLPLFRVPERSRGVPDAVVA